MNSLTTIRDLVYQLRYSEAFRQAQFQQVALSYIKTHSSQDKKAFRKKEWFDCLYGDRNHSHICALHRWGDGDHCGDGDGNGIGDGDSNGNDITYSKYGVGFYGINLITRGNGITPYSSIEYGLSNFANLYDDDGENFAYSLWRIK